MKTLFRYNWLIREDWYRWCEDISEKELLRERVGGVGSILQTLFHIVDVEWSWIRVIQGKSDFQEDFKAYHSLELVRSLDASFRSEVRNFVLAWDKSMEDRIFQDTRPDGSLVTFTWGEILRHAIAHEIHHIGQLSVWSREINKKPISANLIGRGLMGGSQDKP